MINCKTHIALAFAMIFALVTRAEIVLPRVIGSNMVLQRQKPVPVWGTASAGEQVTVKFSKQTRTAVADASGSWAVVLDVMPASNIGQDMTIAGSNTITLHNILIGEVWVCSGQSNMQYEMRKNSKVRLPDSLDKNSPVYEMDRPHNPDIRLFWVNQKNLKTTGNYLAKWEPATQDSALRSFSAAAYFFAKNLNQELHVPVGVICAAISGSAIEPWTPETAYADIPYFQTPDAPKAKADGKFYHSMIEPLSPFAIKGFLWYQGEANVGENISYTYKMEALINSWRSLWNDVALPFDYVQIVPYDYTRLSPKTILSAERLPEFWEAQALALNIPNTGMIETTDLTDVTPNLHPPFKWEIGRRLALVVLAKTYGKKVVYSGPVYKQMKLKGDRVILEFNDGGSPLFSKDDKPLNWFSIAGADGKFVNAQAMIKDNKVIVFSPEVNKPVAVRFAWNELAQPNLFNKAGLPAAPFRTDNPLKFTSN